MKNTLLFLACCLFAQINFAQDFEWANNIGHSGGTPTAKTVFTDMTGNVYSVGHFYGLIDVNPGAGATNLTSAGGTDVYITKVSSSGTFLWGKSIGGPANEFAYSLAVDQAGNVIVTGDFANTCDFDPGSGVSNITSYGSRDCYVLKLDANGNYISAFHLGSGFDDSIFGMTLDDQDNMYMTGYFYSTVDFDPGAGTNSLTSPGGPSIFVAKYDPSGNILWAKKYGSTGTDVGEAITVDKDYNVIVTGRFSGTGDFDQANGGISLVSSGGFDTFILKLDIIGDYMWAFKLGSTGEDIGRSIETDNQGNIYATGHYTESQDFDPSANTTTLPGSAVSSTQIFIAKYAETGSLIWAHGFGADANEYSNDLAVDDTGNVIVCGVYSTTLDFDPGAGVTNLVSNGANDMFVLKFYTDGNLNWARSIGGAQSDVISGVSLKKQGSSSINLAGTFSGSVDFDPNSGTSNLTSASSFGAFVAQWSHCAANTGTQNTTACDSYFWPLSGLTYSTDGAYTASTTNISGCDSVITLNLTLIPFVDTQVTQNGATYTASQSGASYVWIDCANSNAPIAGATSQSFTPTLNGNYAVIIDNGSCSDTSACFVVGDVSIDSDSIQMFNIYPNPTNRLLSIHSDQGLKQLTIRDIHGRVILEENLTHEYLKELDLSNLDNGIYFITLETVDNVSITQKVIKN